MTPLVPADERLRTVDRYRSLFDVADDEVDALVVDVFVNDARLESDSLPTPLLGHRLIAAHIRVMRSTFAHGSVRRVTDVQWAHRTARWCWRWSGGDGSRRGMDVARLSAHGDRIEVLSLFSGLLPLPA